MTSWPGVLGTRPAQALFAGDPWSDHRSEYHLPSYTSSSCGSTPGQLHGVWRGTRVLSSTASGTLQPLSPHLSGPSPPRTTSTAPISGYNLGEDKSGSEDAGSGSRPRNKSQLWRQSLSSSQHSPFFDHAAAPGRNNSAKPEKLLEEVLDLHEEVSTKRYRARDLRHALRHKREEEDDLRLALRNRLNLISPETVYEEVAAINNATENLQRVTESYLVLESEYHKFEDELGQREYVLEKRMTRLNNILRKHSASLTQYFYGDASDSDSSADCISNGSARPIPPQEAEYLSFVGEARMLRERLTELEGEYLSLIDQRHVRERIGMSLDSEALAFLACYEDEKTQIETELDLLLRQIQAHPEHINHSEAAALEAQWQEVVKQFLPESPEGQSPLDRLCVSEFDDRSPFFESAKPVPMNKATFVNRWLLHRLRHSRVEILRFKSSPDLVDLMDQDWDGDRISQMALMFWFRDETAKMVPVRSNSAW